MILFTRNKVKIIKNNLLIVKNLTNILKIELQIATHIMKYFKFKKENFMEK